MPAAAVVGSSPFSSRGAVEEFVVGRIPSRSVSRSREEAPTTGRDGGGGGDDGSGRRISTRRPRDCHRRHRWSDDVADDDDDDDDDDDIEAAWVPLTTHSRSELDGASPIER